MNAAELKLKLFREIDSLEKGRLEELYGLVVNYLQGHKGPDEWEKLSKEQKQGIKDAIGQVQQGKVVPHKDVIAKYRKKYPDA